MGLSWEGLGPLLGASWPLLGLSCALLGRSWDALGALLGCSWALLGRSWAPLGPLLGHLGHPWVNSWPSEPSRTAPGLVLGRFSKDFCINFRMEPHGWNNALANPPRCAAGCAQHMEFSGLVAVTRL